MEYLSINNFLTIKKAEFEVKKINIIIGEQSTGKSIIAKVLYFCQHILWSKFTESATNNQDQRQLKKEVINYFERLFPRYTWRTQEFKLTYTIDDYELIIQNKKNQVGSFRLNFLYNDNLKNFYIESINKVKKLIHKEIEDPISSKRELYQIVREYFLESNLAKKFNIPLFIPANRSFFANLQKNVFSFLANNIEIDPLIREFGCYYENAKRFYEMLKDEHILIDEEADRENLKKINQIVEKIISGRYAYEEEKDWIYITKEKKINLVNASSGQQETLPMLIVLSMTVFSKLPIPRRFFIEEPEAHLFPLAQKDMVKLLTLLYNKKDCSFFITTHSPYILAAFNNLIMAANVEQEVKHEIEGFENNIHYQDIAAYTIKKGNLESILDQEVNLLGTSNLDSVSDVLNDEFDYLLNLKINA